MFNTLKIEQGFYQPVNQGGRANRHIQNKRRLADKTSLSPANPALLQALHSNNRHHEELHPWLILSMIRNQH